MKITDPPITLSGSKKASDHKAWLEGVVDYLQLMAKLVTRFIGDGDGIVAYGSVGTDSYKTVATDPVSMKVTVLEGMGFHEYEPFELASDWTSGDLMAPVGNPRIDTVSVDPADGSVTITAGSEAASPSAPSTPTGEVKIAEIYHRVAETAIKDSDDSTNGYITLSRNRLNFGGAE